jgi:exopolyphosphatase/guanosine-5'-triphosphate,3'-diphosphate pyrophosphatase
VTIPDPQSYRREEDVNPSAVIDIGSNSVRLVVYEGNVRAPMPMFNEKVLCGLAKGLRQSGKLSEKGVARARGAIRRFVQLAESMDVVDMRVFGTAALREASDGDQFAAAVAAETGHQISILSGGEEGRYSALGIVSGRPRASGLMGDLGGGSLELVEINAGVPGHAASFPLGPLRLQGMDMATAAAYLAADLTDLDLLRREPGTKRIFFAVGGAWRALARIHMAQTDYPLRILHEYRVSAAEMSRFCDLIAGFSQQSLKQISSVGAERRDTLPLAALLLRRLIEQGGLSEIVFSGNGVREGVLYDRLSPQRKAQDPLLEACTRVANWRRRFEVPDETLVDWLAPVFPGKWAIDARMSHAATVLSDLNWRVHPDHRADNAFSFALRAPFTAVSHSERVWLALVLYSRYSHNWTDEVEKVARILEPEQGRGAKALGLGLRLAHTLSAGLCHNLQGIELNVQDEVLQLTAKNAAAAALIGEVVEKRFTAFAETLELAPRIIKQE